MWNDSKLTEMLGIQYPVIQAGMAGGITTPELISAVSNAGGLGTLGAGYMTPAHMRDTIRSIKARTSKVFSVNLFASANADGTDEETTHMLEYLDTFRKTLGLKVEQSKEYYIPNFEEQIEILLDENIRVISFTFGVPSIPITQKIKTHNVILIGTATTVREAEFLESVGIDIIIAQGYEAGGHRGTFLDAQEKSIVGTLSLVPQIVDTVGVPVVAAGGIADGRGVLACLVLGAAGVQIGSAFLTCIESGAHPMYKDAVINSKDTSTVLTTAFSGKLARGIHNKFVSHVEGYRGEIPPYPTQHFLTKSIRSEAAKQNLTEYMSLWAGQSAGMTTLTNVKDLIGAINKHVIQYGCL